MNPAVTRLLPPATELQLEDGGHPVYLPHTPQIGL